jgi:hypothetical protein
MFAIWRIHVKNRAWTSSVIVSGVVFVSVVLGVVFFVVFSVVFSVVLLIIFSVVFFIFILVGPHLLPYMTFLVLANMAAMDR